MTAKANRDFLLAVKEQFGIKRIYYPGASIDDFLETAVSKEAIIYLDSDMSAGEDMFANGRNYLHGNFRKSPFPSGIFDAVFYRDVHASAEDLAEILRTLKEGGVVIHHYDSCEEGDGLDLLGKIPTLTRLRLPYSNTNLSIFQKSGTLVVRSI